MFIYDPNQDLHNQIIPGLHQGGFILVLPHEEKKVISELFERFDKIVFCGHVQSDHPDAISFQFEDKLTNQPGLAERVDKLTWDLCDLYQNDQRILITCNAGLNRSGLVTALTLRKILCISADKAIQLIQRGRRGALQNPTFVKMLQESF